MKLPLPMLRAAALCRADWMALVVFHPDKRFNRVRQFDAEKPDAAIQVRQMPRPACAEKFADGFNQLGQQEKIVLKKRVRRHVPVFRRYPQHHLDAAFRRRIFADVPDFLD